MEKATHFLDLAIRLFIKENDGASAILLAGAADEVFGQIITEDFGLEHAMKLLKIEISSKFDLTEKQVQDEHLNLVKNWLKHGNKPTLKYDEEITAIQMILRAIYNYGIINKTMKQEHRDFVDYIKAHKELLKQQSPF